MKTVRFTDDSSLIGPTVKMVCDCGWLEKAFAHREAIARATHHIRENHTTGQILYRDYKILLGQPGGES